jgi:hypothetical protein
MEVVRTSTIYEKDDCVTAQKVAVAPENEGLKLRSDCKIGCCPI